MLENNSIISLIILQEFTNFKNEKKPPSYEEFKEIAKIRDFETKEVIDLVKELNITPEHYWNTALIVKEILENKKGIKVKINDIDLNTPPFELEKTINALELEKFKNLLAELIEENYDVKVDKNLLKFNEEDAWIEGAFDTEKENYFKGITKLALEIIKENNQIEKNLEEQKEEKFIEIENSEDYEPYIEDYYDEDEEDLI